jgi:hypothetical protein
MKLNYLKIRLFFMTWHVNKVHLESWNAYFILIDYDIGLLMILIIDNWTALFQIIHSLFLNMKKRLSFSERRGFVLLDLIFLVCNFTLILIS